MERSRQLDWDGPREREASPRHFPICFQTTCEVLNLPRPGPNRPWLFAESLSNASSVQFQIYIGKKGPPSSILWLSVTPCLLPECENQRQPWAAGKRFSPIFRCLFLHFDVDPHDDRRVFDSVLLVFVCRPAPASKTWKWPSANWRPRTGHSW